MLRLHRPVVSHINLVTIRKYQVFACGRVRRACTQVIYERRPLARVLCMFSGDLEAIFVS